MKHIKRTPAGATQVFCALLAFVFALLTVASVCAFTVRDAMTEPAVSGLLHEPEVVEAGKQRLVEQFNKLGRRWHFNGADVRSAVSEQTLETARTQMAGWLADLLRYGQDVALPEIDTDPMMAAVLAGLEPEVKTGSETAPADGQEPDSEFDSESEDFDGYDLPEDEENDSVPSGLTSQTEHKISEGIANAVRESILPVRGSLILLGISKFEEKIEIGRFTALVRWLPWFLTGLACMLAALILLLCARFPARGGAMIGAGLITAALILGLTVLLLLKSSLTQWIGGVTASQLFETQIRVLFTRMSRIILSAAGALAVLGLVLGAFHRHAVHVRNS